jgi:acyl transferase domain-containing protein
VNSFGFGGTNAHAVLEEAPRSQELASRPIAPPPDEDVIVPLSARSEASLRSLIGSFHEGLVDRLLGVRLAAIAYTAAVRREHHEHRFAPVVSTSDALCEELRAYLEGGACSTAWPSVPRTGGRRGGLVFVFSGQGGLWEGVGRDLYEREDAFRMAIDDCDRWLIRHLPCSLKDCLMARAPGVSFGDPELDQPLQFAIQVALAALWRSWGIVPDAVVGHSLGEIAAAHVAGALSLEDAARIVALRGRTMKTAAGRGGMVAVALAPDEVRRRIAGLETELCLGAINGPTSVTVSGDAGAVERFADAVRASSSPAKILDVNIAFHSPQMDAVRRDLEAALDGLSAGPASIRFASTVTGEEIEGADLDAAYWGRNVREPVLFAAAMETLSAGPYETYLELGPHPVLASSIMDCLASRDTRPSVLASLRRCRPGRGTMLRSLSVLYSRGFEVDWPRIYLAGCVVSLPTYPWQRERYWFEESHHADEREDRQPAIHGNGSPASSLVPGANGHATHRGDAPARSRAGQVEHDRLLYVVSWEKVEKHTPAHVSFEGYWLILGNRGGLGERLRDQIQRRGGASRIIEARSLDPLDGPCAGDTERFGFFRSMLEETRRAGTTIRGVVFLEGLDHEGDRGPGLGGFEAAYRAPLANLLHVARALAAARFEDQPRLWIVTRGAQCAGGRPSSPSLIQAALWGMGRSIAKELPENWGALIDLDPEGSSEEAVALAETIGEIGEEDQFAYRCQECYVPRLVPMPAEERNGRHGMVVRPGGTYLITGGLGALGLEVARYLVERGARRLILLGRKALPERTAWETLAAESPDRARVDAVRALEEEGASVMTAAVDVGDGAAMRSLFEQLERTWPPLRGVVHAAGVVEPLPIEQMDLDRMLPTLRPKIGGTWILHELTARAPIDFFLLFSSVSSIWGSPRQVDYTAANAFLDAMAQHRRSHGLSALSINWGPWAEIGMASREGRNEALAKIGVRALPATTALEAMDRLAGWGATQAAVIDVDWPLFKSLHGWSGRGRLLSRVGAEGAGPDDRTGRPEAGRRGLFEWPVEDRPGRLVRHICERASGVLKLPRDKVDPDRPLLSFGLDSLTAMELKNVIESDFNLAMPLALLLQGASIREMATELCSAVREVRDETSGPTGPPVAEFDQAPPHATATAAKGDTERIVRIGHVRRDGPIPASFAQQRLWYLDQLDPGNPSYNIPTAVRLEGRLDLLALQRALDELIRRHEALRTTFGSEDGVPHQVIAPRLELILPLEDLSSLEGEERARLAELRIREQAEAPFDLAHGPLIRARLLRLSEREHNLLLTVHHIIADGWSVRILIRELTALYEACRTGASPSLPELPVQYADFAAWQHDRVRGELLQSQLGYWTRRLSGLEDLELPTDRPRPTVFSHRGGERSLVVSQATVESLRVLGGEEGATLFMTLLAAFQVLLHRYSGQTDLAVGTPIAGRALPELEGLIGFFLNTLVIRADLSEDPGFREVLRRVRDSAVEAYSHQDVPFEKLVRVIRPDRGTSRSPLFRAMFVTQKGPLPPLESPDLVLSPLGSVAGGAKFDLTLYAFELPEGMRLTMEYSADLFDASSIENMLVHYRNLLEGILVHPDEPIGSLAMLSEAELTRLLGQWNGTASDEHGASSFDAGEDDPYGPFEDLSSSEVVVNE